MRLLQPNKMAAAAASCVSSERSRDAEILFCTLLRVILVCVRKRTAVWVFFDKVFVCVCVCVCVPSCEVLTKCKGML